MNGLLELERAYAALHAEAEQLAGTNSSLTQRAAVYHHLYEHSRGNHVFPLIAAHGALWAKGYFAFGMRLGWLAAWQFAHRPELRRAKRTQLAEFADAFRNVNRLVCVETYAVYHFTRLYADHPLIARFVPDDLLTRMAMVHRARRTEQPLSTPAKREVFEAFFLNEQETVVGPKIEAAVAEFDWPLMRSLALRPHVHFAYLPRLGIQFFNFADKRERVRNGLRAFDAAMDVGLERVEQSLRSYRMMPASFFENSRAHFHRIKQQVAAPVAAPCEPVVGECAVHG